MASLRRSLALSFAERYTGLVITTASTMVLARILTPTEIGIYSVGVAFVYMAHKLRDFGIANYLVQEKELTEDRIRTAFGFALVVAWSIGALLYILSGSIASFYDEPKMREIMVVLAASFLVIPFGSPILALLRRDMNFAALYRINICSAIVHASVAVAMASLGHGFMSLAWASLAGTVTTVLVASLHRPQLARILPNFKEWRRVASFGGLSSAAELIAELGMIAPDLILGRMLGFNAVGLYSRAIGTISIFNQTVLQGAWPVMTPAFASRSRAGQDNREAYLKGSDYIAVVAWPFFVFLGFMAFPVVRVMFGDQWDDAVVLVQIMCGVALLQPFTYLVTPLLIGMGKMRSNLMLNLIVQPSRVALIVLASFHSLQAVVTVGFLIAIIQLIAVFHYLRKIIGLRFTDTLWAFRKSCIVSFASGAVPAIAYISFDIGPGNIWLPLLVAGPLTGIVWLAAIFAVRHPVQDELILIFNKARAVWERRRQTTS